MDTADKFLWCRKMGAFPIDLVAIFTKVEFAVIDFRFRFEPVEDSLFGNGVETAVTPQAAPPGGYVANQIIAG